MYLKEGEPPSGKCPKNEICLTSGKSRPATRYYRGEAGVFATIPKAEKKNSDRKVFRFPVYRAGGRGRAAYGWGEITANEISAMRASAQRVRTGSIRE